MSILSRDIVPEPWYKKGWGILLIAFGVMLSAAVLYIGAKALIFYRQIQLGDIPTEIQHQVTHSNIAPPAFLKENLAYSAADDPTFGKANAPLRIVEFADFECPFSKAESLVVRELMARFPDKIQFIYRDFPLVDVHPNALRAAEAGNCARE